MQLVSETYQANVESEYIKVKQITIMYLKIYSKFHFGFCNKMRNYI
jgi:hypothetical protein